jgi:hypothetical protein
MVDQLIQQGALHRIPEVVAAVRKAQRSVTGALAYNNLEIPGNLFFDPDFSPFNFLAPISRKVGNRYPSSNLHAVSFQGRVSCAGDGGGEDVADDGVGAAGDGVVDSFSSADLFEGEGDWRNLEGCWKFANKFFDLFMRYRNFRELFLFTKFLKSLFDYLVL